MGLVEDIHFLIDEIPPYYIMPLCHDDVIKWKHFRVTGHLCWEFTGHRWIPRTEYTVKLDNTPSA